MNLYDASVEHVLSKFEPFHPRYAKAKRQKAMRTIERMDNYDLIKPSGEDEPVPMKKVSLELAQSLVGGYVEVVPMFTKYLGHPCVVLCNEEGKINGLDVNNRATLEWKKAAPGLNNDMLVGDILILQGSAMNDWR